MIGMILIIVIELDLIGALFMKVRFLDKMHACSIWWDKLLMVILVTLCLKVTIDGIG